MVILVNVAGKVTSHFGVFTLVTAVTSIVIGHRDSFITQSSHDHFHISQMNGWTVVWPIFVVEYFPWFWGLGGSRRDFDTPLLDDTPLCDTPDEVIVWQTDKYTYGKNTSHGVAFYSILDWENWWFERRVHWAILEHEEKTSLTKQTC